MTNVIATLLEMVMVRKISRRDRHRSFEKISDNDPTALYYGTDLSGRVFVNVPVIHLDNHGKQTFGVITLFQLYTNRNDIVGIETNLAKVREISFVGMCLDNLTMLKRILDGEHIRYHSALGMKLFPQDKDKVEWIDLKLHRPEV